MKLLDVLMVATDPDMPVGLTINIDNLEFYVSCNAGDLSEGTHGELHKREILSLDVEGNRLSLELK